MKSTRLLYLNISLNSLFPEFGIVKHFSFLNPFMTYISRLYLSVPFSISQVNLPMHQTKTPGHVKVLQTCFKNIFPSQFFNVLVDIMFMSASVWMLHLTADLQIFKFLYYRSFRSFSFIFPSKYSFSSFPVYILLEFVLLVKAK